MDFAEQEKLDGLRFAWNVWPSNRLDAVRNIVPLGCFVTPVKVIITLEAGRIPSNASKLAFEEKMGHSATLSKLQSSSIDDIWRLEMSKMACEELLKIASWPV